MGLGSRLLIAFVIVIGVMVTSFSVFALFSEFRSTRLAADQKVGMAASKVGRDNIALQLSSEAFARVVLTNGSVMQAYARKDRSGTKDALNNLIRQETFPGFVTIIDENGAVFYSTETPNKHGFSAKQNEAVQYVLQTKEIFRGATDFSATQTFTMSSILPIFDGSKNFRGLVAVSHPLTSEYLLGEVTKFGMEEPTPVQGI
ncbi:MAG: hypothetical protein K2X93_12910, partial [Candidatus Obscuribacterales bacterium]|nr:hypothetical protein [Candidatus Obscuribacterales bacterium]